jgi:hypothetical protein
MNTISITKLYDQLSTKLGKETAENLTTFIDNKINDVVESKIHILSTKEDFAKLSLSTKEDISLLREDFLKLSLSTKEEFGNLKEGIVRIDGKIDSKFAQSKTEMVRWMFAFWIGQMIVTFGFILLFHKK